MFIAHASRTMANGKFKPRVQDPDLVVRTIQQVRTDKLAYLQKLEAEARSKREEEARLDAILKATVDKYRVIELHKNRSSKAIIREVAEKTGVSYDLIMSPSRNKRIVAARDQAIRAVCDEYSNLSLPQIGRIFGRDHTTILHSLRKTRRPDQAR